MSSNSSGQSGGGDDRGGERGGRGRRDSKRESRGEGGGRSSDLVEKTVRIRRCAAVVKGGRRFSFSAMVVVGDGRGKVGCGHGKANEVPPSVEKAVKDGTRNMFPVPLAGKTIPHVVEGQYGATKVVLIPAAPGTGVIAGAAVRAVCEAAGIHDILTKCYGSTNPSNVVKATISALKTMRTRTEVERLRGVVLS